MLILEIAAGVALGVLIFKTLDFVGGILWHIFFD